MVVAVLWTGSPGMHTGRPQRHESEVEVGMGMMRRRARAPITKDHQQRVTVYGRYALLLTATTTASYGLLLVRHPHAICQSQTQGTGLCRCHRRYGCV